jgi:hypothetical protein
MKRIVYRIAGELQDSEIITDGVCPFSTEAEQIKEAVASNNLLFDRNNFHGHGTVFIVSVENV